VVWGAQATGSGYQGTGSGCSSYEPMPPAQQALQLTGCTMRVVADVSAVADPYTGVSVYDSYSSPGHRMGTGWMQFGGTSAGSPIIASIYAMSGNTSGTGASLAYSNPASLNDVTSGTNWTSGDTPCAAPYLCNGEVGFDGPTGLGTPNGTGAF
jgi:subtilase family serine protease